MKRIAGILISIILALPLAAPAAEAAKPFTLGDYEYTLSPGGATITGYGGSADILTLPDELNGYPVIAVAGGAFCENETITRLTVPDGVLMLEDYAFEYCYALERVSIGAGVRMIGVNPFFGCPALKRIEVSPDNEAMEVRDRALFSVPDNRLITYPSASTSSEYALPEGTEIVGAYAFLDCYRLTSVTLPDSVKVIDTLAFYYCTQLEYVELGRGIEWVGVNPFADCRSLRTVKVAPGHDTLAVAGGMLISKPDMRLISYMGGRRVGLCVVPEGIRIIGDSAFYNCGQLAEIALPGSVVRIEGEAFALCGGLRVVNIPGGVTEIEYEAFSGCSALAALTLPESLIHMGKGAFAGCDALTLTVHPNSYAAGYAASAGIPHVYAEPNGREGGDDHGAGGWHFDNNNPHNDHAAGGGPAHRGR